MSISQSVSGLGKYLYVVKEHSREEFDCSACVRMAGFAEDAQDQRQLERI